MAKTLFNARIKHRTDTTANWNSKNPKLFKGEFALEQTSSGFKFKIGDGVNNWKSLPYLVVSFDNATIKYLDDTKTAVATSEANAKQSEINAKTSENNALSSSNNAKQHKRDAQTAASESQSALATTTAKAESAAISEQNAKKSEANARQSELMAKEFAELVVAYTPEGYKNISKIIKGLIGYRFVINETDSGIDIYEDGELSD